MGKTFVDGDGREWQLRFNVSTLRRIRDQTDINLGYIASADLQKLMQYQDLAGADSIDESQLLEALGAFGDTTLGTIARDPSSFCDVLFAIVSPEAERRGVTAEDFVDKLDPESLDAAANLFWQEYSDFFRRSRGNMFYQAAHSVIEIYRGLMSIAQADIQQQTQTPQQQTQTPGPPAPSTSGDSSSTPQAFSESSQAPIPSPSLR